MTFFGYNFFLEQFLKSQGHWQLLSKMMISLENNIIWKLLISFKESLPLYEMDKKKIKFQAMMMEFYMCLLVGT